MDFDEIFCTLKKNKVRYFKKFPFEISGNSIQSTQWTKETKNKQSLNIIARENEGLWNARRLQDGMTAHHTIHIDLTLCLFGLYKAWGWAAIQGRGSIRGQFI